MLLSYPRKVEEDEEVLVAVFLFASFTSHGAYFSGTFVR
jgi:hypothetical protein